MISRIFLALFDMIHQSLCPHHSFFITQKSSKNILKIIGT